MHIQKSFFRWHLVTHCSHITSHDSTNIHIFSIIEPSFSCWDQKFPSFTEALFPTAFHRGASLLNDSHQCKSVFKRYNWAAIHVLYLFDHDLLTDWVTVTTLEERQTSTRDQILWLGFEALMIVLRLVNDYHLRCKWRCQTSQTIIAHFYVTCLIMSNWPSSTGNINHPIENLPAVQ